MNHLCSSEDQRFRNRVEAHDFPVTDFDHRSHLRLAYIYIVDRDTDQAAQHMRDTLIGLLKHAGVDPSAKYHETLTKAWILAIHHFMKNTSYSESADHFIDQNPDMLDSKIMMTHYSAEVLFSEQARREFVAPNLDPIPNRSEKNA